MKVYEAVIYRDEPDEAAVDIRTLGWEDERGPLTTPEAARDFAVRRVAVKGWPLWTATIHEGHIEQREREGVTLDEFIDEERVRWYVGPDWFDREVIR